MAEERQDRPHGWAILAAAGMGSRFGTARPKQFCPVAGVSLLGRTIRALRRCPAVRGMVVAVPSDRVDPDEWLPTELGARADIRIVAGGPERTDSVREGLRLLPPECNLVLVHDGVRPAVTPGLVDRVAQGAWRDGACVPVLQVYDAVKEVDRTGRVKRTLERQPLRLVQTPQGFRRQVLEAAYRWVERQGKPSDFPDDAALVEAWGGTVTTVDGETDNIKVTVPGDLTRMGLVAPRVGFGYDVHRLVPDRKLFLGGVEIPFDAGLMGHSDGDAALHALCDAVLGAAGLGDIGRVFPDDDPRYGGARSLDLLRQVASQARRSGWRVSSVDLTVVAQRPRLSAHLPVMARTVAQALGLDPEAVGFKATTEEGLGFTGSLEGIAAHAVAVLVPHLEG